MPEWVAKSTHIVEPHTDIRNIAVGSARYGASCETEEASIVLIGLLILFYCEPSTDIRISSHINQARGRSIVLQSS